MQPGAAAAQPRNLNVRVVEDDPFADDDIGLIDPNDLEAEAEYVLGVVVVLLFVRQTERCPFD